MHPIRARHGHLVAVPPRPAPAPQDQSREIEISVATGQLHASTEAFSLALEAACSAAGHIEWATARGAGSDIDLDRVERHEAKLRETFRRFETALAHLRRKHHGVEA
jgi:hypothetical protein